MQESDLLTFDVSRWPALPGYRGLMVVGTDTGVGKTLIAGVIARQLRHAGIRVAVFKPAASGCRTRMGRRYSEDADFLAACADTSQNLKQIAPLLYTAPAAPNVAAAAEGVAVDLDAIFAAYRDLGNHGESIIVEGVGGLLCPITDDFWVIHFAKLTALPVVIVARATLGTINHTLLTLSAARRAGLTVAGVVINRFPADGDPPYDRATGTNAEQIAQRGHVRILAIVPNDPDNSVEKATVGPTTDTVLSQVPWQQWMSPPGRSG